jgi:hypothetical protein
MARDFCSTRHEFEVSINLGTIIVWKLFDSKLGLPNNWAIHKHSAMLLCLLWRWLHKGRKHVVVSNEVSCFR